MTKQELAAKIWGSTNELRGNIELGTYKDYMLSLLFYKFLSDKEEKYLLDQGWTKEDMKSINEDDIDSVADCQRNLGYFISYDNLFSTWIRLEHDFTVRNVTDALNAFDRLIGDSHKRVFSKIFETLQSNISNLGTTAADQTKALSKLIEVIDDIPTDQTQGYDVLGFIYEFLISNFAANAGKKAGEFYTPHEVSVLMSEIISHHLQGRETIRILDPTSGSGSLLITIGKAFAKYSGGRDNVDYYAQEFIKSTYNLTRMNLIMKGILPNNIHVRNGDTLASDWPYFDDSDPENTYFPLPVDAVVSNPPYSQKWDSSNREGDPRFSSYGIAPKSKADYAFLLYDLYHIRPDGIAAIILPHGVLYRGNEEGAIRQNLIDNNKIDTIIGLPANLFFGTGIPTILMILKQTRDDTGILFVDASKGFIKNGNKNKLRSRDIKRIADVVISRSEVPKFSRIVSKSEIIANDYNLNIPRYVDSSNPAENWDVYSLMFGGVPNVELDEFNELWTAFPSLFQGLFEEFRPGYSNIITEHIDSAVYANVDVQAYIAQYHERFDDFEDYLRLRWLVSPESVTIQAEEDEVASEIFRRYQGIPLADPYAAYQVLDNQYSILTTDLELIQAEGFSAAVQKVDPNMVTKKKDDKTIEVQDGFKGHVLPFKLVQQLLLPEDLAKQNALEKSLQDIQGEYEEILATLSQEELDSSITNDDGTAFASKGVGEKVKEILADVTSPEIEALQQYLLLLTRKEKKPELLSYIRACSEVNWSNMEASKSGTYTKGVVSKYINHLQQQFAFDPDSLEFKLFHVSELMEQEKVLKKAIKENTASLEEKTIELIHGISDEDAKKILAEKWICPLASQILKMPKHILNDYIVQLGSYASKYVVTITELEVKIKEAEIQLHEMLKNLRGTENDIEGLESFLSLLGNEASLEKMIPSQEENTPAIRFSGFTSSWNKKKLGDMGTTYMGLSGKTKDDFGHGAGRFVTYMNVFLNPVSDITRTEAVEIDRNQNTVQYGDIFFTTSSETPEEVGMSSVWLGRDDNLYLNSFCFGYRPNTEVDPYYMAYMLRSKTVRSKIVFLAQGISRYNISKSGVMDIEVPMPNIDEQRLIGKFFYTIDELIALNQNKYELQNKMKRALQQRMFL